MSVVHQHSMKSSGRLLRACSVCHSGTRFLSAAVLGLAVVLSSGCATTGEIPSGSALTSLLQQAQEQSASGSREKALVLLEQAAKEHPTNKEPWLRIAQIHFDISNYPLAMQAAQEALTRDPLNQEAKGVLIVSGLRVAARAISELRNENALSGSTRNEAEKLAKSLRETLGETVLVPPAQPIERAAARETPARVRVSKPVARLPRKSDGKTSSGASVSTAGSSDPFGALR